MLFNTTDGGARLRPFGATSTGGGTPGIAGYSHADSRALI